MTDRVETTQDEWEMSEEALYQPTHPEDGIYEIPAENLRRLEKKIAALAKKSDKLGLPPPELEIVGERLVPVTKVNQRTGALEDTGKKRKVYDVTVSGQSPIIEGWLLIAVIDHFSSGVRGMNMIRRYPQETEMEIPDEYRTISQRCDHCQTNRRRKDTFLLSEVETGEYKLVGRQCLKDFLGHQSPEALANYARFILDLMDNAQDESWGGNGWQAWYLELDELLTTVAAVMRKSGWLGRTKAREQMRAGDSTADRALSSLTATKEEYKIVTTDEDEELARLTIQWLREVLAEKEHMSDYEWNLVAATAHDELDWKNVGVAASAVYAYKREHRLLEEQTDENGEPKKRLGEDSEYQGKVKERLDLTLTIRQRHDISIDPFTRYGNETLHITVMEDEDGNIYVWKTTAKMLEEGKTYSVRGTVKTHEDYNGIKQTILTRCAITCAECGGKEFHFIQGHDACSSCSMLEKKFHMMEVEDAEESE